MLPPLLHAMGSVKPWQMKRSPSLRHDPRSYYERYYLELSPYLHEARRYRFELDEACEWLNITTVFRPTLAFLRASVLSAFRALRKQVCNASRCICAVCSSTVEYILNQILAQSEIAMNELLSSEFSLKARYPGERKSRRVQEQQAFSTHLPR